MSKPVTDLLPPRIRFLNGAYYYRVPKGSEYKFDGKQTFRIGTNRKEAIAFGLDVAKPDDVYKEGTIDDLVEFLYKKSKKSARTRNKEHTLTKSQLRVFVRSCEGRCELSEIQFDAVFRNGYQPFHPSLDRIDSSRGYTADNVRIVCVAMNVALGQWGEDVFRQLAEGYLRRTSRTIEVIKSLISELK